MAKTKISEYDSTAANNTDIDSINIAEGMAPSNVNNAIRELMAHLKDGLGAGTPVFLDQTNNRLGVGTSSPSVLLDLESTAPTIRFTDSDASGTPECEISGAGGDITIRADRDNEKASSIIGFEVDGSEAMRIDSSGNVGIGTSSPVSNIDVRDGTGSIVTLGNTGSFAAGESSYLKFRESSTQLAEIGWEANTNELRINNRIAGPISFYASNAHTMRVTSGQDLHIQSLNGSTHEAAGYGPLQLGHTGKSSTIIQMLSSTSGDCAFHFGDGTSGTDRYRGYINYSNNTDFMSFGTSTSERMRISSSGMVGIGRTDPSIYMDIYTGSNAIFGGRVRSDRAGAQYFYTFEYAGSGIGSIQGNNTSTSYNTTSDYRLKENIIDITDGITRVKQLEPRRFNFIVEPDRTVDGFIAHEAEAVVPEAVTGTKDAMKDEEYTVSPATGDIYTPAVDATYDDDGNELTAAIDEVIHSADVAEPETLADGQFWRETTAAVMGTRSVPDYQGIDQSKLVPLLTAALQEAIAKIETLETRVAALEG